MLEMDPSVHLVRGLLVKKEFVKNAVLFEALRGPLLTCATGSVHGDLALADGMPFITHPETLKNCAHPLDAVAIIGRETKHHWDVLRTIKQEFDASMMKKEFRENKPSGITSVQFHMPPKKKGRARAIEQGFLIFIGNQNEIITHLHQSETLKKHAPRRSPFGKNS